MVGARPIGAAGGVCTLAIALLATAARAEPRDDYFSRLTAAVHAGLDQIVAARPPKLVPPVPVNVKWKAVRMGSLELGAPLVAMTAGDLDGDGKAELYAVTTREVIAVGLVGGKPKELGRVAFAGEPAAQHPRDAVGTALLVERTPAGGAPAGGAGVASAARELVAAASPWAQELRVSWNGNQLVGLAADPGFLVCPGERLALVPGRDHFGDLSMPVYGVRCRGDLVDAEGVPLRVRATLVGAAPAGATPGGPAPAGTTLSVTVEKCRRAACTPAATSEYKNYGVAFEVADVDRDGTPEVIVTGAGAPGDPDAVKVITLGKDAKKGLYRKSFTGGVAAVAVADGHVIAAVRLLGATRVDLWRLD